MSKDNVAKEFVEIKGGGMLQLMAKPISMLLIGLILGVLASTLLISSDIEILYISQDELIDLEKDRIKKIKSSSNLELFNGQVERVIGLIEDIAKSYESVSSKVVFSRGPVNGDNVRSISQEVHTMLIQSLTEGNSDKGRR